MGLATKSIFYLLFLVTMMVGLSNSVLILPELSDDYVDMVLAARAGAMAMDQEATASAGKIILDPDQAKINAETLLSANNEDIGRYEIYVINNAPVLFRWQGQEHFFNSNGVAVGLLFAGQPILKVAECHDD